MAPASIISLITAPFHLFLFLPHNSTLVKVASHLMASIAKHFYYCFHPCILSLWTLREQVKLALTTSTCEMGHVCTYDNFSFYR
jgi:hypothetical protein